MQVCPYLESVYIAFCPSSCFSLVVSVLCIEVVLGSESMERPDKTLLPCFLSLFLFHFSESLSCLYLKTRVFGDLAVLFITERAMLCLMYFMFFLLCVNTVYFCNQASITRLYFFYFILYGPLHTFFF